jgi:hypothetical protein
MHGFSYLLGYYKKTYLKPQRFRYSDGYRFKSRKRDLLILKYNYRYIFFLFSFLDFMARNYSQSYPFRTFNRRTYISTLKLFFFLILY